MILAHFSPASQTNNGASSFRFNDIFWSFRGRSNDLHRPACSVALNAEIREANRKGELAEIRTQSDLAQKQLDLLMEEIEQGAAKEHAAAAEAKKKATEAAIRAKRETDRAAAVEAARKAEDAKLIEPATTANAALLEIANRIEQGGTERVLVSRQEAAIFADAISGVGFSRRLHGEGRGDGLLKNLEDGGRQPVGKTLRSSTRSLRSKTR